MTEHKYLDNHGRARCTSSILSIAVLALGLAALLTNNETVGRALVIISSACACVLTCFVIHYISHNSEKTAARPMAALHAYAVHAILSAALVFAGSAGSFSNAVVHALLDGALAALLVLLAGALLGRRLGIIAIIAGAVSAVLSLFWANAALDALLSALAAALIVAVVAKWERPLSLFGFLLGLATLILSLMSLIGGIAGHDQLHLLVIISGFAMTFALFALIPLFGITRSSANNGGKQQRSTAAGEVKIVSEPVEGAEDDVFDREKWIVKKYHGLSADELLMSPVDALYGVSEGDALLLTQAFNVKTIGDLANNKFFQWASEIVDEASREGRE